MAAAFETERAVLEAKLEFALALARAPEPSLEPPQRRRPRRRFLESTIKQAKRGGADRVEIDPRDGRIVIRLTGAPGEPVAEPNGGSNELEDWIAKHEDKIKGS
jgi:hypothetical protein